MKTATFTVISGNKQQTMFMRCCDVFPASKVLGKQIAFETKFADNTKLNKKHLQLVIERMKQTLETQGEIVTFIHVHQYRVGNKITLNEDCHVKPYFNPEVQTISNGHQWGRFVDYLKQLGLKHTHDEHFFIKSIG